MTTKYILAMDQGTTSSRTIIFDAAGKPVVSFNKEFEQIYPKAGWVEHNPLNIWNSQLETVQCAIAKLGIKPADIAAIGITNQRETTIVWDKETGKPIYNAIVWQCRRTASICDELKAKGWSDKIRSKTGLVVDAYFSGTKIKWILDNVAGAREKADKGELLFGNVDSWLIWKLTGEKVHVTDYSNASRTMIFNIHKLDWDDEISPAVCCRRLIRPVSFMVKRLRGFSGRQFPLRVLPETNRQRSSGRRASSRVWLKILTGPVVLC
jgi:glycerol kinase